MFSSNATQVSSVNYIEDVFSTYLYTGNGTGSAPSGAAQTITNGVDLAGKGGLVWVKNRSSTRPHALFDTTRGAYQYLTTSGGASPGQGAQLNFNPGGVSAFNSDGFTVFDDSSSTYTVNGAGLTYASWTFRKQPKFFDVVTFTSSASGNKTFSHNLGVVPGCVIIKNTQTADPWLVYHRSVGDNAYLQLNSTAAQDPNSSSFSVTSTTVTINTNLMYNSQNYVAYLFAHDAGGFGLSGNDNVISCASYVGNGSATSGPLINLGYEPQWLMVKRASSGTGPWSIFDTMRGLTIDGDAFWLNANTSDSDSASRRMNIDSSTGFHPWGDFTDYNESGITYIYIAIRRGPMKVPTLANTVFSPIAVTASTGAAQTTGFPVDLQMQAWRDGAHNTRTSDRLRGVVTRPAEAYSRYINTDESVAEADNILGLTRYWTNTGFQTPSGNSGLPMVYWNFRRAPSFFDEVCYTGTGGASQTFTHNLGVAPELVIVKCRDAAAAWESLGTALSASQRQIYLNRTQAGVAVASGHLGWNGTDGAYKAPTSSVVYFGGDSDVGGSGLKYVAYLFATCAGVSKVGSYTGTGATQAINCGFAAGARFVMIKRTDSTGDWYVWDSARGIVAGNDPYLLWNSVAAEVASTDYIDTSAAGFEISSTAPAAINASGGSYIFLAVA